MPIAKITPQNWPQDELNVPSGGAMPPIDIGNRTVTRGEYAAYSALFLFPFNMPQFTTLSTIINTDQDGDFWCDQIGFVSWLYLNANPGLDTAPPGAMVTIEDIRTGRSLVHGNAVDVTVNQGLGGGPQHPQYSNNAVPLNFFRKFPQAGIDGDLLYTGQFPLPTGFRDTGTLIQPFCFTRQGGIKVTMQNMYSGVANFRYEVTLLFSGWKEYADASK